MKCNACNGSGCEQVSMGHGNIDVVDCSICYGKGSYPAYSIEAGYLRPVIYVEAAHSEDDMVSWEVETIGL